MFAHFRPFSRFVRFQYSTFLMELTGHQLHAAEEKLKSYFPKSLTVFGCVKFKNRFPSDYPMKVLVDKWPDFNVVVCKPEIEDLYNETAVFSKNKTALEAITKDQSVLDWTTCLVETEKDNVEIFKALSAEKQMSIYYYYVCHMLVMSDFSRLQRPDSAPPGTSFAPLNESHFDLVYETSRSLAKAESEQYVRNMIRNFPSCCLLDSRGRPMSWVSTNPCGALCLFHTLPEHRGRGYGQLVLSVLIRRLCSEGLPVFAFVEKGNSSSLRTCSALGFTEDPSYREVWFTLEPTEIMPLLEPTRNLTVDF